MSFSLSNVMFAFHVVQTFKITIEEVEQKHNDSKGNLPMFIHRQS